MVNIAAPSTASWVISMVSAYLPIPSIGVASGVSLGADVGISVGATVDSGSDFSQ